MDDFYGIGSKASDFYYVINNKNRYQYWSKITNKIIAPSKIPSNLLPMIQKQPIQDILLNALIQQQSLEKQIIHCQTKVKNFKNQDLSIYSEDSTNPNYFHIINNSKKFIYNHKFEILSMKELRKLRIDPKSIQLAPLHVAQEFYQKRIIKTQEKLSRLQEKWNNLPNTQTNPECSLHEILEYQKLKQARYEEYKKEPTFFEKHMEKIKKQMEEMKKNGYYSFDGNWGSLPTRKDDLLKTLHISSKKDLHKWLLIHHTDKGGDNDTCQKVLAAAKRAGFMH